jgi:hypothetical protein
MRYKIFLVILIVSFLFFIKTIQAESPTAELQEPTATQMVAFYFGDDAKRMEQIFKCESGLRQFDTNGNVIMSHTRDFGVAQINEKTWDSTAKEMGLDYKNSMIDNLKMARHIYDVQGKKAWVCASKI